MVSPLACQVGSCLVWPCYFPRLVLFGLVPSSWGPVVFLVGPAPPVGGSVFYRGMVWLMLSLHALTLPPPPPCGVGPVVVLVGPAPACVGAVCSTGIWYGCCCLLAVMSSFRARYHTTYDVALFSLQTVPLSLLLMRFSAPVKKHWLGSFSIVLAWVRSGCAGPLGWGGRGGVPGPESIYTYTYKCIISVVYVYVYIFLSVYT